MANNYSTGDIAIAVCDRCKFKYPYLTLRADGDKPGLRVCPDCWDTRDPYRLPPRQPEALALRFPRPDVSIAVTQTQAQFAQLTLDQFISVLATDLSVLARSIMAGYQTDGIGE